MDTINQRLRQLLDTANREEDVQVFFERNPILLIGTRYLQKRVLVSKLPLGSEYKVDFAYVTESSEGGALNLVEIENPRLKLFTKKDDFTTKYRKAVQQLIDWKQWCQENKEYLRNILSPLFDGHARPILSLYFRLIVGRRREIDANQRRRNRWASKTTDLGRNIEIRSYDSILEEVEEHLDYYMRTFDPVECVVYREQDFEAKVKKIKRYFM